MISVFPRLKALLKSFLKKGSDVDSRFDITFSDHRSLIVVNIKIVIIFGLKDSLYFVISDFNDTWNVGIIYNNVLIMKFQMLG